MCQRGIDISRRKKKTDILGIIGEIVGDSQDISLSINAVNELNGWVDKDIRFMSKNLSPSIFNKFKILHFLSLNREVTRYRLSRELEIPHASTSTVVGELCDVGMIRTCKVEIARTGLPKLFYAITSFGMLPLINLHSPSRPPRYKELLEIAIDIQKDFTQIAANCKSLPMWSPFLRNWIVFEKKGAVVEIAYWLAGAGKSYINSQLFFEEVFRPKKDIELSQVANIENDIKSFIDGFYEALIRRVLDSWFRDSSNFDAYALKAPLIFDAFLLNPELRNLLLDNVAKYRIRTKQQLDNIQDIEDEIQAAVTC
jgi:hypothetical protein